MARRKDLAGGCCTNVRVFLKFVIPENPLFALRKMQIYPEPSFIFRQYSLAAESAVFFAIRH